MTRKEIRKAHYKKVVKEAEAKRDKQFEKTAKDKKRSILIARAMQAKAYARAVDAERDAEYLAK